MSMAAPRYMSNEEYLKWYDFEKDTFREGTPQHVLDMVRQDDEEREQMQQEALKEGYML